MFEIKKSFINLTKLTLCLPPQHIEAPSTFFPNKQLLHYLVHSPTIIKKKQNTLQCQNYLKGLLFVPEWGAGGWGEWLGCRAWGQVPSTRDSGHFPMGLGALVTTEVRPCAAVTWDGAPCGQVVPPLPAPIQGQHHHEVCVGPQVHSTGKSSGARPRWFAANLWQGPGQGLMCTEGSGEPPPRPRHGLM